jgi:hypothetical protein
MIEIERPLLKRYEDMRRQDIDWKNIFAKYISDKELLSKTVFQK